MAPLTATDANELETALDLELDLRDRTEPSTRSGVIDLSTPMRPSGPRRASRHTHVRLVAALARIQAEITAGGGDGAGHARPVRPGR